jgi:hypothetical protein
MVTPATTRHVVADTLSMTATGTVRTFLLRDLARGGR